MLSHGPVLFKVIQEYYKRIKNISNAIGDVKFSDVIFERTSEPIGVLPGEGLAYEESLMDKTEYRMSVIYHLALSRASETNLSWESFVASKHLLDSLFKSPDYESLSNESIMMKVFSIDPIVIPRAVRAKIMSMDEFKQAAEIIFNMIEKTRPITDGFEDYDDYFDYMRKEAEKIEKECHSRGYYGTHELDRFAVLCISHKMKTPTFDVIYQIPNVERTNEDVDIELIKDAQAQMLGDEYD